MQIDMEYGVDVRPVVCVKECTGAYTCVPHVFGYRSLPISTACVYVHVCRNALMHSHQWCEFTIPHS